jgi:S1-C subfamily serine protease
LLNAAGEVVGINTMIVGGNQGIAIPSAVAVDFVQQVKLKSSVLN